MLDRGGFNRAGVGWGKGAGIRLVMPLKAILNTLFMGFFFVSPRDTAIHRDDRETEKPILDDWKCIWF